MSPAIQLDDVELYYREIGAGTPLILLHGLTLSGLMWTPQIASLSRNHRVIIPDLRGHGKSSVPDHGYSFHNYAIDIKNLFDYLNLQKTHVIGLSLGGAIATEFCVAFPDSVHSAIIISSMPPYFEPDDRWVQTLSKFRKVRDEFGLNYAVENVLLKEPIFGKINIGINDWMNLKNAIKQFSGNPIDTDFSEQEDSARIIQSLPALDLPFLIMTGEKDHKTFIEASEALSEAMTNSKRVIIKNAGHLCTMEQPEEVNSEILKFLKQFRPRKDILYL